MTAQEFAQMVNSGNAPWLKTTGKNDWTDSTKEQYFNFVTAEQANEMELERWRLNNDYNSPRAQMQRMIEAGINPAAAYQSVSSGNSSSAPNVHQPGAAAFHDTTDKLQRINTIMTGIKSIMSSINDGVDAVAGIQGVAFKHQNNWYDKMRAQSATIFDPKHSDLGTSYWISRSKDYFPKSVEIAPGLYMEAGIAQMFPEFTQGFGFQGGNYDLAVQNRSDQHAMALRRTRIDQLIQNIMHGLEGNVSTDQMMKYFLQLFMYGAMSKFGGY